MGCGDNGVLRGVEFGRDFAVSIEVPVGFSRSDRVMDARPETLRSRDGWQMII